MSDHTLVAVDLAKNVFEVAVSHKAGKIAMRKRLSRDKFAAYISSLQPVTLILEACGMAHYWARRFRTHGHQVVLLPAHAVKPYVQRSKTDQADAKALLEAYRNEDIRHVPPKSTEQQSVMALHRLRSAWVAQHTARINTLRGLLREFGVVIPVGARHVVPHLFEALDQEESPIPKLLHTTFREAGHEIADIKRRILAIEKQLQVVAQESDVIRRLGSIPGIGLITATALFAFVGDVHRFRRARQFASYLGLTPKEKSSGQKRRLGRISKQGDIYLRMLLIHGGRSVLRAAHLDDSGTNHLRTWARQVQERRGHNKAAVAVANKLARFAWVVWRHECEFDTMRQAA
jgi:transposase